MAEFTLHCLAQSGNAYKAALMLELCGADWQPRLVELFSGATRVPEYRAMNDMGEVPVLEHRSGGDTLTFTQSGVILTYLGRHFERFGARDEQEEYEIWRWILFDNHKLAGSVSSVRLLRHIRGRPDHPAIPFLRERAHGALAVLDRRLEGRHWVVGDRPTIADLSLCGYLFWPEQFGESWDGYPNLAAWLDRIRTLDGWKMPEELMPAARI